MKIVVNFKRSGIIVANSLQADSSCDFLYDFRGKRFFSTHEKLGCISNSHPSIPFDLTSVVCDRMSITSVRDFYLTI